MWIHLILKCTHRLTLYPELCKADTEQNSSQGHPTGTSVNSVICEDCSKFCLLHYNVGQWEFQISHCLGSTIIFIKIFFYSKEDIKWVWLIYSQLERTIVSIDINLAGLHQRVEYYLLYPCYIISHRRFCMHMPHHLTIFFNYHAVKLPLKLPQVRFDGTLIKGNDWINKE